MKKLLSATALVTAVLIMPARAELVFNPYIGADYQFTRLSYAGDGGHDSFSGFNIHAGNRFSDHFGLELGYFRTGEQSATYDILGTPTTIKGRLQGVTLDALGYLPVTEDNAFELVGTVGLAYTHGRIESAGYITGSDSDNDIGFRVGGGAQYNFTQNLNARALVRFQTVGLEVQGIDVTDNAWIGSFGLNYRF